MYTDEMAKELKKSAGKKWRPANGTEGDMFEEMYCEKCQHSKKSGEVCDILTYSFFFDIDRENYPKELQIGNDGQPTCIEFKNIDNEQSAWSTEGNPVEDIKVAIESVKKQSYNPQLISFQEALYHDTQMLYLAGYNNDQINEYIELVKESYSKVNNKDYEQ
jgi:hypothetical protein